MPNTNLTEDQRKLMYGANEITSFRSAVTENVGSGVSSFHNANVSNANVGADISTNQNANQSNTH